MRTLPPWPETIEPIQEQPFGIKVNPDEQCVTVSADGQLILLRGTFNFTVLSRQGNSWLGHSIGMAHFPGHCPVLAADSQLVVDQKQIYSTDGKPLGGERGGPERRCWCVPALQGGLTLTLNEAYVRKPGTPYAKALLHVGSDPEPLVDLPRRMEGLTGLIDWFFSTCPALDRHVFFAEFGALAVIPKTNDRLELHRFDLNAMLKEAKGDYLFALSQPPDVVAKGVKFSYTAVVKSKAGGLKYTLETPPAGMAVTADGVVTWEVPASFAQPDVEATLLVRDGAGHEVRQPLHLRVTGK